MADCEGEDSAFEVVVFKEVEAEAAREEDRLATGVSELRG